MEHKPKIIGTGLSGLVGSRLVEIYSGQYDFVDFSLDTGVDILNPTQLTQNFDHHSDAVAVIHMAAFTDTNAAWNERGDKNGLCYKLNVNGTANIIEACQKHNLPLVFISTDFVFDGDKQGKYTEADLPNPIEWYGQTKYEAEKLVTKSSLKASIARISFPYRAFFEPKKDIVRKTIEAFQAGRLYPMFSDQITTLTLIDDIAAGIDALIRENSTGIYHLVGGSSQSPFQMCLQIADIFGFDSNLVKPGSLDGYVKSLPPGSRPWQKNLGLDNIRLSDIGIRMSTLTEGLKLVRQQMQLFPINISSTK